MFTHKHKHIQSHKQMASSLPNDSTHRPHIVLFPFMSKGHTIPLLHLARMLVTRGITVTIFTTKANKPFIAHVLETCPDGNSISIIHLPFPSNIEGIPDGIESTDKLPSISLFTQFAVATKHMQPHFEMSLKNLGNVTCIVSDGFLSWTLASANKFGIPRLSFYGMNAYSTAVQHSVTVNQSLWGPESDDELITVPGFPWIQITRNDIDYPFTQRNPSGPFHDFIMESFVTSINSYGTIVNTFQELEPRFIDYINREMKPTPWCVGPLCLAEPFGCSDKQPNGSNSSKWITWLDQKLLQGSSVLYVAFGSQAEISTQQMEAISKGLEQSEVNFLWVVRNCESNVLSELGDKVGDRGMIVTEWVNQMEILKHDSVNGFVSHCGWNSVLESICAGVPILAWPMMAEQPLNARMVVEEIKIGLRVETCDGSVRGFVKAGGLKKMVKELMEGEKGKEVRKRVKEVGAAAKAAVADGGSSWRTLNELINEVESVRNKGKSDGEM
ncbi:putative UDP-glucuronosyl/UDP-glucosyltransferase, UDP-glycosyltransferase family [Helianthus annuus]|nr:putative UDP-glucuronosyl/UDP-glucosyltransferase, UDP-glycosyltransferase family [Helianthus annuus]